MNFLDKYKINNNFNCQYYKVYDKNGKFLYNIDIKDEKKLTNGYLKGVTCFVINQNNEVLLEKRANTELTPGKIDLVSGHINNDEIGYQAMVRELGEEVGISENEAIKITKIKFDNQTDKPFPLKFEDNGNSRDFLIEFYYLFSKSLDLTIQEEEVKSLEWVPLETAFEMIKLGKTKFPKQSEEVNYEQIFNTIRKACLNKEKNINQKEKKVFGE